MNNSEQIWRQYHDRLAAFIRKRVAAEAVDDILQEVFLAIHDKLFSLDDDTTLEPWLYQVTRNKVVDYHRKQRPTENLPTWLEQPEADAETAIRQELSSCLDPMIKQLPEKYRQAIYFSDIEQKSQQELASMAGISLSGAKSRVQRGRRLLKEMLHDCCQIEVNRHNQLLDYAPKKNDCGGC